MSRKQESALSKAAQVKIQEGNDHVQTNFEKLIQMQSITTAKQFAYLLQSMKEDPHIQKMIINKNSDIILPKNIAKDKKRKQVFQNYKKLMSYSLHQKQKHKFRTESSLDAKKALNPEDILHSNSLHRFVQNKKHQMILEQNFMIDEQKKLENAMKDSQTRAKILQEALLFQRLYTLQKDNQKRQKFIFPKNYIKLNPRHLRIPQKTTSETQFYRRKYVHNQKTFNFHRQILRLHNQVLQKKIQNNMLVIKKVLDFNQLNTEHNQQNRYQITSQNLLSLKKLFLKYSSDETDQIEDIFKYITKVKIAQFFDDFSIKLNNNQKMQQIINQDLISEFDFMQIFYFLSNVEDVGLFANINQFLQKNILSKKQKILIQEQKIINLNQKFLQKSKKLKRFSQKTKQIFQIYIVSCRKQKGTQAIDFNQIMELMWELKLYPYKLSKKKIRFFYEYLKTESNGLSLSNLQKFFTFTMLSFQGQIQNQFKAFIHQIITQSLKVKSITKK